MRLIASLKEWIGVGQPAAGSGSCPQESDILKYQEGRLNPEKRRGLEEHFAGCHDCRELLLLLTRFHDEPAAIETPSGAEIQQQTARVLQYIEEDDKRQSASGNIADKRKEHSATIAWVYRYGAAAAALLLFAVAGYLWMSRDTAADQTMESLRLAVEKSRPGPARISGGFRYAESNVRRGADDSPDVNLRIARSQSEGAEAPGASAELRLVRARVFLATNNPDRAEEILNSLLAGGAPKPEVYNDLGVAYYQLQKFDLAIEDFSRALEKKPDYGEALFNRALARQAAREYPEARADWEQFIKTTTDDQWRQEAARRLEELPATGSSSR